eukprot:5045854-Karenia_brevis.AAC.1
MDMTRLVLRQRIHQAHIDMTVATTKSLHEMYEYCLEAHSRGPDGVLEFYINRSRGNYQHICDAQIACLQDWKLLTKLGFDKSSRYNIYSPAYEDNAEQSALRDRAHTLFYLVLHLVAKTVEDQHQFTMLFPHISYPVLSQDARVMDDQCEFVKTSWLANMQLEKL